MLANEDVICGYCLNKLLLVCILLRYNFVKQQYLQWLIRRDLKMDKPQIIVHVQKSVNFTLHDCRWIPSTAKFVLLGDHARGSGAFQIFEVSHGDVKLVHEVNMQKNEYQFKISLNLRENLNSLTEAKQMSRGWLR